MTDWNAEAIEVAADLAEEGFTVTLNKVTNGSGDFWTNDKTEMATTITVLQDTQRVRDGSGTLTERTVRTLFIAATGPTIEKDDVVVMDGNQHRITAVRPLAPGGVVIMYEADIAD